MDHGTDRDVAQSIVSLVTDIVGLVSDINRNFYSVVILEQPVDFTNADLGDTAIFTVSAANVTGYQWQWRKADGSTNWTSTTATGNKTASISVEVTEQRLEYEYRCAMTGKDGVVVYSDAVKIVAAES